VLKLLIRGKIYKFLTAQLNRQEPVPTAGSNLETLNNSLYLVLLLLAIQKISTSSPGVKVF